MCWSEAVSGEKACREDVRAGWRGGHRALLKRRSEGAEGGVEQRDCADLVMLL